MFTKPRKTSSMNVSTRSSPQFWRTGGMEGSSHLQKKPTALPRGTQRPALWKMSSLVICILVICGCGAYLHNRTWPASIRLGDSYPIRTHRNFWGARVHSPAASFSDGVVLRGMRSGRATETCHNHWVRQQWGQDLAEDSGLLVLSS